MSGSVGVRGRAWLYGWLYVAHAGACHYELVDSESSGSSHLWDGSDPDWVILAMPGEDDDGGLPYNQRTEQVELICDDDLAVAVLRTMRAHGVSVVQLSALDDHVAPDQ